MEAVLVNVKDNEFLRQFEATFDDKLAAMEYSVHPRNFFLTKLVMDESLIENGSNIVFLESVFEYFKENNIKVVPTAPAIVSFFRKNRKAYKQLLPTGISI